MIEEYPTFVYNLTREERIKWHQQRVQRELVGYDFLDSHWNQGDIDGLLRELGSTRVQIKFLEQRIKGLTSKVLTTAIADLETARAKLKKIRRRKILILEDKINGKNIKKRLEWINEKESQAKKKVLEVQCRVIKIFQKLEINWTQTFKELKLHWKLD